jgi:hypothetical protein
VRFQRACVRCADPYAVPRRVKRACGSRSGTADAVTYACGSRSGTTDAVTYACGSRSGTADAVTYACGSRSGTADAVTCACGTRNTRADPETHAAGPEYLLTEGVVSGSARRFVGPVDWQGTVCGSGRPEETVCGFGRPEGTVCGSGRLAGDGVWVRPTGGDSLWVRPTGGDSLWVRSTGRGRYVGPADRRGQFVGPIGWQGTVYGSVRPKRVGFGSASSRSRPQERREIRLDRLVRRGSPDRVLSISPRGRSRCCAAETGGIWPTEFHPWTHGKRTVFTQLGKSLLDTGRASTGATGPEQNGSTSRGNPDLS